MEGGQKNKRCHYFSLRATRKQSRGHDEGLIAIYFKSFFVLFLQCFRLTSETVRLKMHKKNTVKNETVLTKDILGVWYV